ncbi:activating signal cointegrator 1 complex subunit [Blomia tropicalis]|nr:activating signal cointegrator 1 complex subunit [Blomia tropicalis]
MNAMLLSKMVLTCHPIVDRLSNQMKENGLIPKESRTTESVKLHITLMNTAFSWRQRRKFRKNDNTWKPIKNFDSTSILEYYKDFVFAEINTPPIQLNDVRDEGELGYYKIVHSFPLVNNSLLDSDH